VATLSSLVKALTAALLQTGVTGLFFSLMLRSTWGWAWTLTIVTGFGD
jgi:hypothetical protein